MDFIGTEIAKLPTPCLVIDQQAMQRNRAGMCDLLQAKGKSLRAHAKAHKSTRIAALQLADGAVGICAAKLSEAEGLSAQGIPGILITGPVVTEEAHDRLIRCVEASPDLMIALGDSQTARRLSTKLEQHGLSLSCLVDLDVGQQRSGIALDQALAFAHELAALPNLKICGVQAYAGHLQHISSFQKRAQQSRQALEGAAEIFRELRRLGFAMDIFSVGGTGTTAIDTEIPEVTEIQAGSYLFMDEEYAAIEWQAQSPSFEPALSLVSTVLSANHAGWVTIDAGLKTMYRDGAIPRVLDFEGAAYEWFGDEYGKVTLTGKTTLSVGDKVRLSISHADPTVNLFDFVYVVEGGVVVDVFDVDLRGCSQ